MHFLEEWKVRLACMQAIAIAKFKLGKPIRVVAVEKKVMEDVRKKADENGLTKNPIENFFLADIQNSVEMQIYWHKEWQNLSKEKINYILNEQFDLLYALANELVENGKIDITDIDFSDHTQATLDIARKIILHTNETIIKAIRPDLENLLTLTRQDIVDTLGEFIAADAMKSILIGNLYTSLANYHTYQEIKTYVSHPFTL